MHTETPYTFTVRASLLASMMLERIDRLDHSVREPEEYVPAGARHGELAEDGSVGWPNPLHDYTPRLVIDSAFSAYSERIRVLRREARLEGYAINSASEAAFWKFFFGVPNIRRGRLVLLENGNLRAVWKRGNDAHIGLQFLDQQSVQYVIFARRDPLFPVSRVTGCDTIEGVRKQIIAFDLAQVLCE